MRKKIIILGGGLTGLAAANILSKKNDVTILEKDKQLGGLASSFEMDGEFIPKHYHHVIWHNDITKRYLAKYGLLKSCQWKKIKVAIGIDKKLYNINEVGGLLSFNNLSFFGKMRFGLFGLYTIFLLNPNNIKESENAESWLLKYAGKEVTDKIFYNLYARNKFNLSLKHISAKQLANRLKEKEVYEKFTFPRQGLQKMIDGLENDIKLNKGKIHLNSKIKHIDLTKKQIVLENNETIETDIIINTIPLPEFFEISEGLPESYIKKASKVHYCPAVGVTFATENFLDKKNYWINLFQERIHIIMQHSLLIDKYKHKVSWCLRYGGSEEDLDLSDEEIRKKYLGVVKKYFPKAKIVWAKVFKEKYAEPVYDKDYKKYMPDYKTPVKDVYMAGIQVTYPKIRNMNSALESGEIVAKLVLRD